MKKQKKKRHIGRDGCVKGFCYIGSITAIGDYVLLGASKEVKKSYRTV